jgi:replicative DNA helicase
VQSEPILTSWDRRYGVDDLEQFLDPAPAPPQPAVKRSVPYIGPERPGDAFNARHTGGEILQRLGFTMARRDRSGDEHWVRPGKERRQGSSATVYAADGHTTIWSDTCRALWPAISTRRPMDPFGLYCATSHGGDFRAATSELSRQGYGEAPRPPAAPVEAEPAVGHARDGWPVEEEDDAWPDPEPLEPQLKHGPAFPVDILPTWMGDMAKEIAEALLVPVDLPAVAILGALSTVTQTKLRATVTGTSWSEDTNLYLMCGFPSGGGKSPAFAAAMAPIEKFEAARIEEMRPVIEEAEMRFEILSKRAKDQQEGAVKKSVSIEDAIKAKAEATDVAIPPSPAFIVEDATPEALGQHLDECGGRGAILSSEGDLVDDFAGRYATQGKGAPLGVYLKPWGGESIRVKRVGRGLIRMASATLTICVMPQPILIRRLGENSETGERGLNARFLYSVPATNIGWRDYESLLRPANSDVRQTYEDTLVRIAERFARCSFPLILRTTPEATARWISWMNETEQRMRPGRDLEGMSGWVAKLRASTLRLAALLRLAGGDQVEQLDEIDLERAFVLADYWIAHYKAVHAVWVASEEVGLERAYQIVKWALDHDQHEFSVRDVFQSLKRKGPGGKNEPVEEFVAPLQYLVDTGWLRADTSFPTTVGRRGTPSPRLTLHPEAKRFAPHDPHPSASPPICSADRHELGGMGVGGIKDIKKTTTTNSGFIGDAHERGLTPNPHGPQVLETGDNSEMPLSVAEPSSLPADDDDVEPAW